MSKKIDFSFPSKLLRPVQGFLKKELQKVQAQMKRLKKADPFSDPSRVNDNAAIDTDVAEQVGHSRVEAKGRFLRARMVQIRKALSRIKIGRYGICEECGEMIDTDRLLIYPETTVCVKCVKERES